jgi:predicted amidophosphoribosyltransferase
MLRHVDALVEQARFVDNRAEIAEQLLEHAYPTLLPNFCGGCGAKARADGAVCNFCRSCGARMQLRSGRHPNDGSDVK